MKRVVVIFLTVCMLLSFSACDSQKKESNDMSHKVGIAFFGWNSNPNWLMVSQRLHDDYDDKGFTFIEKEISTPDDIPTAIENFIISGCDIVVIHGLFKEPVKAVLPQLIDAGIAVGCVDNDFMADGATYCMLCDNYKTGYALGESAAEWANSNLQGNVVAGVLGYEAIEDFAMRGRGIIDALNEHLNNGKVVIEQDAANQEQGLTAAENMLSAYPDLNLIGTWNSGAGVGAYEALKAAGWNEKEANSCGLFSIDASNDELAGILEGGCYKATMEMDLRNQWLLLFEKLVTYADNDFEYPEGTTDNDKIWAYPLNVVYEDRANEYLNK